MEIKTFNELIFKNGYTDANGNFVLQNPLSNTLTIKFKKLDPRAVTPTYAHPGEDAGLDMTPIDVEYNPVLGWIYKTGIAMEIPTGFVGLVFLRSSARKTNSYLTNHIGVIDSGYRGDITVTIKNIDVIDPSMPYKLCGKPIFQIMIIPYPMVTLIETDTLSPSKRGTTGHGDSDNLKR